MIRFRTRENLGESYEICLFIERVLGSYLPIEGFDTACLLGIILIDLVVGHQRVTLSTNSSFRFSFFVNFQVLQTSSETFDCVCSLCLFFACLFFHFEINMNTRKTVREAARLRTEHEYTQALGRCMSDAPSAAIDRWYSHAGPLTSFDF